LIVLPVKLTKIVLVIGVLAVATAGFAVGRISGDQPVVPEPVKRAFPSLPPPPQDDAPKVVETPDVIIEVPAADATITSGFEVAGRYLNDGRGLTVSLKDSRGQRLFETRASQQAERGSEYGRFKAAIPEPVGVSGNLVIEVMSQQPGGPMTGPDAVRIVTLPAPETMTVKLFYNNDRLDPVISCTRTYPVEREIEYQAEPHLVALEALVAGPTEDEELQGYANAIPEQAKPLTVKIDGDGVARAEFDEGLSQGVAGSCLVSAIRAQITATLQQFTDINEVVISVDGEVEEALQP
jgi:hypothetical protein